MKSCFNCLEFGQQDKCLEKEPIVCESFGLCELITYKGYEEKDMRKRI